MKTDRYHRGHLIEWRGDVCVYVDTGTPVPADPDRACGHCGMENTPEGHDGCLKTLPGVMNACCGHGDSALSYVQIKRSDGVIVRFGPDGVTFD